MYITSDEGDYTPAPPHRERTSPAESVLGDRTGAPTAPELPVEHAYASVYGFGCARYSVHERRRLP